MSKRNDPPMLLDLSDLATKRNLMQDISTRQGLHEVSIRPRKFTRSSAQNRYYWSAVVLPFAEYLRREWGDGSITTEQAHIELKMAVLGPKQLINKSTGEVKELVPTSHDLDTGEFSNYIERASLFLAESCGIVVLPSEMFNQRAA